MICKRGFLDFVHRLYFNKITLFRKLDLLPSSGEKEGQKTWSEASSTARVSVLPFYLKTEEDPASETLLFY
jgi:hypothetical protein